MHRSPSPRRRKPARGRYRVNDAYRLPFPGLEPEDTRRATYEITPLGHVFRDDGLLLRPHAKSLKVKLNHGTLRRSVPAAVFAAFGKTKPPSDLYVPWVRPDAPIDQLTGRRSCAVRHVKLVHRGDLIRLHHGTITLKQLKRSSIGIR